MTDVRTRLDPPELIDLIDKAFDAARTPWLMNVDLRPCAVAFPDGAGEVTDLVRHARRTGWRIAMQSTGHHADTLGELDPTILVRTSRMRSVTVDPMRRTARVGAGAVWSDVARGRRATWPGAIGRFGGRRRRRGLHAGRRFELDVTPVRACL